MDSIAAAARRHIVTLTDVLALVGAFPATDPVVANRGKPWVFNTDIACTIEGSGAAALVCSSFGGEGSPPALATPRFLRLAVDIWVDPARDGAGNATETAGATIARGLALFTILNHHLHRTDPDTQLWGDMVTASCELRTEPQFFPVSDAGSARPAGSGWSNRPQLGTAFYGVAQFGWSDARA